MKEKDSKSSPTISQPAGDSPRYPAVCRVGAVVRRHRSYHEQEEGPTHVSCRDQANMLSRQLIYNYRYFMIVSVLPPIAGFAMMAALPSAYKWARWTG